MLQRKNVRRFVYLLVYTQMSPKSWSEKMQIFVARVIYTQKIYTLVGNIVVQGL